MFYIGLPEIYREGDWYTAGYWDITMILYYASAMSVLLSFLEELITRVIPPLNAY